MSLQHRTAECRRPQAQQRCQHKKISVGLIERPDEFNLNLRAACGRRALPQPLQSRDKAIDPCHHRHRESPRSLVTRCKGWAKDTKAIGISGDDRREMQGLERREALFGEVLCLGSAVRGGWSSGASTVVPTLLRYRPGEDTFMLLARRQRCGDDGRHQKAVGGAAEDGIGDQDTPGQFDGCRGCPGLRPFAFRGRGLGP